MQTHQMKLTKAQKIVLERLASGGWCMDRHGSDLMQAKMSGPGWVTFIVSAKTVSFLLAENYIGTSIDGITDFQITNEGRNAIGFTPSPQR